MSRMAGRFEIADGATLFLDEIGDLPLEVQAKLLRVLEEGRFERLGSTKSIKVNVRILAATNRDLDQMVRSGKFREDLYYRLNVFPIIIPPLREHQEDIPPLIWAFIHQFEKGMAGYHKYSKAKHGYAAQLFLARECTRTQECCGTRNDSESRLDPEICPPITTSTETPKETGNLQELERQHIRGILKGERLACLRQGRSCRGLGAQAHHPGSQDEKAGDPEA